MIIIDFEYLRLSPEERMEKDLSKAKTTYDKFSIAVRNGNLNLANELLQTGEVKVNPEEDEFVTPPLYNAACSGQLEMVKFLIGKGANVNQISSRHLDNTSLKVSILCRHWDVFNCLLENGADVNAKAWQGNTALHEAANLAQYDMDLSEKFIHKLLLAGADPDAIGDHHKPLEIASLLIKSNCLLNEYEKARRISILTNLLTKPLVNENSYEQKVMPPTYPDEKKLPEKKLVEQTPTAFLSPTTIMSKSILRQPYLGSDGESYEEKDFKRFKTIHKVAINIALKNLIEAYEKKKPYNKKDMECPITLSIMFDPVTNECGQTYERIALETLPLDGEQKRTDPNTRGKFSKIIPNLALKQFIQEYLSKRPAFLKSTLKEWLMSKKDNEEYNIKTYDLLRWVKTLSVSDRKKIIYENLVRKKRGLALLPVPSRPLSEIKQSSSVGVAGLFSQGPDIKSLSNQLKKIQDTSIDINELKQQVQIKALQEFDFKEKAEQIQNKKIILNQLLLIQENELWPLNASFIRLIKNNSQYNQLKEEINTVVQIIENAVRQLVSLEIAEVQRPR